VRKETNAVEIKVVDSIQYHLWSDALHARELARQTQSPLDRGAYVRWAIQAAWTAFENVSMDALEVSQLGMRFKEKFKQGVAAKGFPAINWGSGVWQKVLGVYEDRKTFTHVIPSIDQSRLTPDVAIANNAIDVLRDGIKSVCTLATVPAPAWVIDDADRGWQGASAGFSESVASTLIRASANADDPLAIKIAYVLRGEEHFNEIAPPGTDHGPILDRLQNSLTVPVESVRAYRGTELIEQRDLKYVR
jgi:hypothetical protein